jgi:two-component system, OmpR family, response regulator
VQKRILIIDDDETFRRVVRDNLIFEGFLVDAVASVSQALASTRSATHDLILLDLMLPDGDGFNLCRVLRGNDSVPIIVLSARGGKADKLTALNIGADDYLTKPFDLDELLARIRAVLRRTSLVVDRLSLGRLVIDFQGQLVTGGPDPVRLTHREFKVLYYLAERRDRVVHRDELLKEIWGYVDTNITTRSVDNTIARLRKKIEPDPRHPQFICTVHGDGYCLNVREVSRAEELNIRGTLATGGDT